MELWMIWLILATVFLILEIVSPAFLFICFTGGAIGGAAASVWTESLTVQIVVFAIVSVVLIPLSRPIARKLQRQGENKPANVDAFIGRRGYVTETIDPASNTGRLRIGSETWRATADGPIAEGAQAEVIRVDGVTLIVREAAG